MSTRAEVERLQQLAEIRLQESMRQEMAKEEAEARLAKVVKLHEALLNTLEPSKSSWIQHVVRNARAALAEALRRIRGVEVP